ncbi:cation:proton antiporter [Streptomyces sp. NPDC087300]|uniref:cation:proton antiporter domain-containing protein n=1 Tax=Streptomyces sp. NPDC087300 TaxID=3365780 RepID=UPI00382D65B5
MTSHQVQFLFADLALILLLARGLGQLAIRLRQPPVVGEIFAGILLGPTLLDGAIAHHLFPTDVRPLLSGMANLGVALFMFCVGLEINTDSLRGRGRVTAISALGSTAVPFVLGVGLALGLPQGRHSEHHVAFVIFIGLTVSVTAFPVLARILADRLLARTTLGSIALATAAVVDLVAWTALAIVQASVTDEGHHWTVTLILPYGLLMALVVRPLLRRVLTPAGQPAPMTAHRFAIVLTGALLSATATEAIGMHFIFGAFVFGLAMPRRGAQEQLTDVLDQTTRLTSLLLPVYFVMAGLQVDLGGIDAAQVLQLGAILVVAVVGKFGGTYLAARTQGLAARPAAALGALMNTRGLTELVILGVGLQLGLLDGPLYSLLVVMAVVTTAMTGPLLTRIYAKPVEVPLPPQTRSSEPAASSRSR